MRAQKHAGNSETLVEYDRIGYLADQAKTLHLNYVKQSENEVGNDSVEDIFDM